MWDNSERNPLETAGFEQWEIIFEEKKAFSVGIFFVSPKPDPSSCFSGFVCKQFELIFAKSKIMA